ncbi:hypothetical protein DFJ73DRAFT_844565 [Zopfochytrium polystomum]|nr:hypothetical protein DFJ73DRAFT_844565 [Zopfochytrium polystomum]
MLEDDVASSQRTVASPQTQAVAAAALARTSSKRSTSTTIRLAMPYFASTISNAQDLSTGSTNRSHSGIGSTSIPKLTIPSRAINTAIVSNQSPLEDSQQLLLTPSTLKQTSQALLSPRHSASGARTASAISNRDSENFSAKAQPFEEHFLISKYYDADLDSCSPVILTEPIHTRSTVARKLTAEGTTNRTPSLSNTGAASVTQERLRATVLEFLRSDASRSKKNPPPQPSHSNKELQPAFANGLGHSIYADFHGPLKPYVASTIPLLQALTERIRDAIAASTQNQCSSDALQEVTITLKETLDQCFKEINTFHSSFKEHSSVILNSLSNLSEKVGSFTAELSKANLETATALAQQSMHSLLKDFQENLFLRISHSNDDLRCKAEDVAFKAAEKIASMNGSIVHSLRQEMAARFAKLEDKFDQLIATTPKKELFQRDTDPQSTSWPLSLASNIEVVELDDMFSWTPNQQAETLNGLSPLNSLPRVPRIDGGNLDSSQRECNQLPAGRTPPLVAPLEETRPCEPTGAPVKRGRGRPPQNRKIDSIATLFLCLEYN